MTNTPLTFSDIEDFEHNLWQLEMLADETLAAMDRPTVSAQFARYKGALKALTGELAHLMQIIRNEQNGVAA